ncbi:MAG TPA: UvrD-helicase domain-containing protein [Acidimicrobiales bacterium]|nr:UvrD-helicase domain-containing protein [Acidimicrobiales bacterium]
MTVIAPPAPAPPRDQAARVAIRSQLQASQFVEAGAGTGKTTAMVARILELVTSGEATIDQVAAITFTDAAAAELRDRVYEALERASIGAVCAEHRARARAALDEIDGAAICTLHGFAQRILAAHPFEAGLPPAFEVLDEGRSAIAFDERWEGFVDELLDDPGLADTLRRLLACGVRLDHLRTVTDLCNDNWDLLAQVEPGVAPLAAIDRSPILDALDAAHAAAETCTCRDDKLLLHIESLAEFRTTLRASTSELEVLELLVDPPKLTSTRGQKGNWPCPVAEVRGLLAGAEAARRALVAGVISEALAGLVPAIRGFTITSANDRKREGRLEFHDLLVVAVELIRNDAAVRVALHHQYQRLLIDEFQDTDPIQAEMAFRIANGCSQPGSGEVPWSELPVEPGRLFFVGDPKQAIYRFRRADIGLFLDVRDRRRADLVALTANFRSVPGIIGWINAVFGELFDDGARGTQPEYQPLHAERSLPFDAADGSPPVILLGGPMDAQGIDEVRAVESAEIAATIRRIREEKWPVGDRMVPARLSDITILIPTRTGLPMLRQAFDAEGVPYRLESSSLVYEAPEVGDLLTILRAIDDPTDQVSTVTALRSEPFGCGDDDLVAYRQAGGRWDYRQQPPVSMAETGPVVRGMAALHALHRQRWWSSVSALVERVIEECRLLELALDQRRSRDVWRRLRFVADQARQFTDVDGGDLRRYLAWVEVQRRQDVRAREVVLPETDDDAVRVMTVHGAKGLEFPIVFLTGLNRRPPNASGVQVLWGAKGPEMKIRSGMVTAGYEDLAAREKLMEEAEELRLLYVAATRARDYLVVALHHKIGSRCRAAQLAPLCDGHRTLSRRLESVATGIGEPAVTEGDAWDNGQPVPLNDDVLDSRFRRSEWVTAHRRLVTTGSRSRTLSATTVAGLANDRGTADPGGDIDIAEEDPDIDLPPWRRGRAGTSIGRAVHAVLQTVDLASGLEVDRLAETQAVAEGIDSRAREIARLVRAALGSEIVGEAVSSGRYWREMYIGAPATDQPDGPVIEGIIDLLIETPDGYTVVDYKTDAVRDDEELTRAMHRYRLQGATYSLAVERALGCPVSRCVFLFVRGASAIQRDVPDVRLAMAEVEQLVGAVSGDAQGSAI